MRQIKNKIENIHGGIDCIEIHPLHGEIPHTIDPTQEYEVHESSEWQDVKPLDQAIKDSHAQEQSRDQFKIDRAAAMASLTIETPIGVFDADETSQTRMSRAIAVMNDTDATLWVLADNTAIEVTKAQLIEALLKAGQAQSALWVQP